MRRRKNHVTQNLAASLVEFAIALPIFILFLFCFIEFARYLAIRGVLSKAAHIGLTRAIIIPELEHNIKGESDFVCAPSPPPPPAPQPANAHYCAFKNARAKVINAATSLALGSMVSDHTTPSSTTLSPYRLEDGITLVDAIVLRPGDTYDQLDSPSDPIAILVSNTFVSQAQINNRTSIKILMRRPPIEVRLRAEMKPLLPIPFLGTIPIEVVAAGYREIGPTGAFVEPLGTTTTTTRTTTTRTSTTGTVTTSTGTTTTGTTTTETTTTETTTTGSTTTGTTTTQTTTTVTTSTTATSTTGTTTTGTTTTLTTTTLTTTTKTTTTKTTSTGTTTTQTTTTTTVTTTTTATSTTGTTTTGTTTTLTTTTLTTTTKTTTTATSTTGTTTTGTTTTNTTTTQTTTTVTTTTVTTTTCVPPDLSVCMPTGQCVVGCGCGTCTPGGGDG